MEHTCSLFFLLYKCDPSLSFRLSMSWKAAMLFVLKSFSFDWFLCQWSKEKKKKSHLCSYCIYEWGFRKRQREKLERKNKRNRRILAQGKKSAKAPASWCIKLGPSSWMDQNLVHQVQNIRFGRLALKCFQTCGINYFSRPMNERNVCNLLYFNKLQLIMNDAAHH